VGVRPCPRIREKGLGVILLNLEDLRRRRASEGEFPFLRLELSPRRGDGGGGRVDTRKRGRQIPVCLPDLRPDPGPELLLPQALLLEGPARAARSRWNFQGISVYRPTNQL
jgi:hypothetical protein